MPFSDLGFVPQGRISCPEAIQIAQFVLQLQQQGAVVSHGSSLSLWARSFSHLAEVITQWRWWRTKEEHLLGYYLKLLDAFPFPQGRVDHRFPSPEDILLLFFLLSGVRLLPSSDQLTSGCLGLAAVYTQLPFPAKLLALLARLASCHSPVPFLPCFVLPMCWSTARNAYRAKVDSLLRQNPGELLWLDCFGFAPRGSKARLGFPHPPSSIIIQH